MNEYFSADDSQTPEEARISALYKEAAREMPPANLDRTIAAAARAGSRTSSGGRLLSWLNTFRIPLATAAVLVVSASLVMTMREEHENRVMSSPGVAPRVAAEPAPAPQISAAEPAAQAERKPEPAPEAKARDRAEEGPNRAPRIARPSEPELRKENSENVYGRYVKSAPPKVDDRGQAKDLNARAGAPPDQQTHTPVPAPMAAPAREPGLGARREAAAPATRDEAAAPPVASTPPAPVEERAPTAAASPQVPATPPADRAAASPPPRPGMSESMRSFPEASAPGALGALRRAQPRLSAPARPRSSEAVAPAPQVGASEAPRERTPEERRVMLGRLQALNLPPPDISSDLAELESRPPSAWLDRVRLLQRQELLLEADRLLAEFKRRFPEEPVPSDVQ